MDFLQKTLSLESILTRDSSTLRPQGVRPLALKSKAKSIQPNGPIESFATSLIPPGVSCLLEILASDLGHRCILCPCVGRSGSDGGRCVWCLRIWWLLSHPKTDSLCHPNTFSTFKTTQSTVKDQAHLHIEPHGEIKQYSLGNARSARLPYTSPVLNPRGHGIHKFLDLTLRKLIEKFLHYTRLYRRVIIPLSVGAETMKSSARTPNMMSIIYQQHRHTKQGKGKSRSDSSDPSL